MRDIIWTVILVWVVWKIVDAFKNVSKMQTQKVNSNQGSSSKQYQQQRKEGEVKIESAQHAHKSHFKPGDGEYVDYEEVN